MGEVVDAVFLDDDSPTDAGTQTPWPPAVVRAAEIDHQVAQLLFRARADADLRRVIVAHPLAPTQGRGLAPGIRVSIEALRPGEVAHPAQTNAASLCFCVAGTAELAIDGHRFTVSARDVWSTPPMAAPRVGAVANGEPLVLLRFSNAALLEQLGVHWRRPLATLDADDGGSHTRPGAPDPFAARRPHPDGPPGAVAHDDRVEAFGPDGPWRLQYERLVDPPWVAPRPWHWPWSQVKAELDAMASLDERYHGRRVCLLHDPATGRTNGTTFNLFASMCMRPAGIVDPPHRHIAAAVNYFFAGEGWSTIGDQRVDWAAGDLMLAAPGWTPHHHASGDAPVYQLAVQDNPLHLAMGSLLWQERLTDEPKLLGMEPGYTTNRHELDPTHH